MKTKVRSMPVPGEARISPFQKQNQNRKSGNSLVNVANKREQGGPALKYLTAGQGACRTVYLF